MPSILLQVENEGSLLVVAAVLMLKEVAWRYGKVCHQTHSRCLLHQLSPWKCQLGVRLIAKLLPCSNACLLQSSIEGL